MFLLANKLRDTFADRLVASRERMGWNQHDLAAAMDKKSPAALRGWEQKTRWPQPEEIEAAAKALGVSPGELLADKVVVREPTKDEILRKVSEGLDALARFSDLTARLGVLSPDHQKLVWRQIEVALKSVESESQPDGSPTPTGAKKRGRVDR